MKVLNKSHQKNNLPSEQPGKLLREVRLQKELSIDDIHKRIRLTSRIIEAIEADDYSDISSVMYAKGYLRSYSKALGLDDEYIVSLFDSANMPPPPEIVPEVKSPIQVSSNDRPAKMFSYLLTLVYSKALGLHNNYIASLFGSANMPPPPEIVPEVKSPIQVSSNDRPAKIFSYLLMLTLVLLLIIWYRIDFPIRDNSDDSELTNSGLENSPNKINNTDIQFDVVKHPEGWQSPGVSIEYSVEPIDASSGMIMELEPKEFDQTAAPSNQQNIISDGSNTLVFNLSNDSWIEIYDANDERLFMDLGKKW